MELGVEVKRMTPFPSQMKTLLTRKKFAQKLMPKTWRLKCTLKYRMGTGMNAFVLWIRDKLRDFQSNSADFRSFNAFSSFSTLRNWTLVRRWVVLPSFIMLVGLASDVADSKPMPFGDPQRTTLRDFESVFSTFGKLYDFMGVKGLSEQSATSMAALGNAVDGNEWAVPNMDSLMGPLLSSRNPYTNTFSVDPTRKSLVGEVLPDSKVDSAKLKTALLKILKKHNISNPEKLLNDLIQEKQKQGMNIEDAIASISMQDFYSLASLPAHQSGLTSSSDLEKALSELKREAVGQKLKTGVDTLVAGLDSSKNSDSSAPVLPSDSPQLVFNSFPIEENLQPNPEIPAVVDENGFAQTAPQPELIASLDPGRAPASINNSNNLSTPAATQALSGAKSLPAGNSDLIHREVGSSQSEGKSKEARTPTLSRAPASQAPVAQSDTSGAQQQAQQPNPAASDTGKTSTVASSKPSNTPNKSKEHWEGLRDEALADGDLDGAKQAQDLADAAGRNPSDAGSGTSESGAGYPSYASAGPLLRGAISQDGSLSRGSWDTPALPKPTVNYCAAFAKGDKQSIQAFDLELADRFQDVWEKRPIRQQVIGSYFDNKLPKVIISNLSPPAQEGAKAYLKEIDPYISYCRGKISPLQLPLEVRPPLNVAKDNVTPPGKAMLQSMCDTFAFNAVAAESLKPNGPNKFLYQDPVFEALFSCEGRKVAEHILEMEEALREVAESKCGVMGLDDSILVGRDSEPTVAMTRYYLKMREEANEYKGDNPRHSNGNLLPLETRNRFAAITGNKDFQTTGNCYLVKTYYAGLKNILLHPQFNKKLRKDDTTLGVQAKILKAPESNQSGQH